MLVEITFAILALFIVGAAMMVVASRELVHSTIWLAGVLMGVAGIFLTLGAEFLAIIQVLVYVGAVITLILFTVMLTIPEERVDFLETYQLPPGVTIERVEELQIGTPAFSGSGPYKHLKDTNPRLPLVEPADLYGVSLVDGEYGTRQTPRDKTAPKEGSK
jgi:hypothetical protein